VFDVHESELDQMKALVQQEMEAAVQLAVPMEVEIEVAHNWLDAH
jgi:DNA polymerase-1